MDDKLKRVKCAVGDVDWNVVLERMLEDATAGRIKRRRRARRDEQRVRRLIASGRESTDR